MGHTVLPPKRTQSRSWLRRPTNGQRPGIFRWHPPTTLVSVAEQSGAGNWIKNSRSEHLRRVFCSPSKLKKMELFLCLVMSHICHNRVGLAANLKIGGWVTDALKLLFGVCFLRAEAFNHSFNIPWRIRMVLVYLPTKLGHLWGKCWYIFQHHGSYMGYRIWMLPTTSTTMYDPSSEAKSRFNQGRSGLCLAVLEPLWDDLVSSCGWVSMENVQETLRAVLVSSRWPWTNSFRYKRHGPCWPCCRGKRENSRTASTGVWIKTGYPKKNMAGVGANSING